MLGECRGGFPRHRLQRKPLVSYPGMHHGTCVAHVPWCMSGSLTHGGGENVPGIPGACATHNLTNLTRGPWLNQGNLCYLGAGVTYGRSRLMNLYSIANVWFVCAPRLIAKFDEYQLCGPGICGSNYKHMFPKTCLRFRSWPFLLILLCGECQIHVMVIQRWKVIFKGQIVFTRKVDWSF